MEDVILLVFLVAFTLDFLIEFVLNELNIRHVRRQWAAHEIPSLFKGRISDGDFKKSVRYTLARSRFQRWAEIYHRTLVLAVLFTGVLPVFDQAASTFASRVGLPPIAAGVLFCIAVGSLFFVAGLPVDLYSTFIIETRFGFNKTTIGLYITDKLKALLLAALIGIPFLYVLLWLMSSAAHYWWLWAFVFITGFQLLMIVIFPTFIAPWFNKFEPLKEGELRQRILTLAHQIGFKTNGIFTMDGSKRSAHSNAYFTGIGKSKRIVLFDTLIEQMTSDQGLAVLAHEMGHYKMKHIRRMFIVQTVILLLGLYLLSLLVNYEPFFAAFDLRPSNAGALVLFSILSGSLTFYLGPLMNLLSRKHEYEADQFAANTLDDGKPMEDALIKLTVKNLANLTPHPWYSAYHYSHPTPMERIAAIRHRPV
jgi:STE24 endopeptidase